MCHASVEESPCEIVNSVLFVLDGLCDYFSIEDDEVIMYEVVKMGLEMWETQYDPNKTDLHWERLIEKFLVELFLCVLTHQDTNG